MKVYSKGSTTFNGHPDIETGFEALFVYSSIVVHRIVGDVMAPLLRTVPLRSKPFSAGYEEFTNPQYVEASGGEFDEIEIDIRRDTGEPIPFHSGKVIVTLHYRLVES